MTTVAILGATGSTGIHLAAIWKQRGASVRVVSRSRGHLESVFPDSAFDKLAADVLKPEDAARAIEGYELVYDCLGLAPAQMHLHPVAAKTMAEAVRGAGARCIQVSSYWAYLPLQSSPLNEQHPRNGGPDWVRWRREAEDILLGAGVAVLNLPDFYGPHVNFSTLQTPLTEAAAGKTMNWIGGANTPREYIYVADAMRIAAAVADHAEAFGQRWVLPGSGPLTGTQTAEIAGRALGRTVKLRAAGPLMLRLVSLFSSDLRGFMQMVPDYMKPICFDASRLRALIGEPEMTSYDQGIAQTLSALGAERAAA